MNITRKQRDKILCLFPKQRGNSLFLDALSALCENGCGGRFLPPSIGSWHSIYGRNTCWAQNGVLERVFHVLQEEQLTSGGIPVVALDSTCGIAVSALVPRSVNRT